MHAPFSCQPARRPPGGFTMTELMVVIGIIAVLAGILLTAMGGVRRRALSTQTESTMQEFAKAAEAFQIEHNRYPGIIPEQVLAQVYTGPGSLPISGTENALLELMGGARAASEYNYDENELNEVGVCGDQDVVCPDLSAADVDWELRVNINRIGEGPLLDGRIHAPYFTPSEASLQAVPGQNKVDFQPDPYNGDLFPPIPDLIDAWGQPIIYVRRARENGDLVGDPGTTSQFFTATMKPYTESVKLGRVGANQMNESVLNLGPDDNATFAQILRHPGFGTYGSAAEAFAGTPRGAFVLISAGPDGIYFSRKDGPGTPKDPVVDIVANTIEDSYNSPRVVEEYDDLRTFGGG
jgi:prepilin-type N-terminal cleavage/methylation domain-containing protein